MTSRVLPVLWPVVTSLQSATITLSRVNRKFKEDFSFQKNEFFLRRWRCLLWLGWVQFRSGQTACHDCACSWNSGRFWIWWSHSYNLCRGNTSSSFWRLRGPGKKRFFCVMRSVITTDNFQAAATSSFGAPAGGFSFGGGAGAGTAAKTPAIAAPATGSLGGFGFGGATATTTAATGGFGGSGAFGGLGASAAVSFCLNEARESDLNVNHIPASRCPCRCCYRIRWILRSQLSSEDNNSRVSLTRPGFLLSSTSFHCSSGSGVWRVRTGSGRNNFSSSTSTSSWRLRRLRDRRQGEHSRSSELRCGDPGSCRSSTLLLHLLLCCSLSPQSHLQARREFDRRNSADRPRPEHRPSPGPGLQPWPHSPRHHHVILLSRAGAQLRSYNYWTESRDGMRRAKHSL